MKSAMVPLDRALLSSYRLYIVIIPLTVMVWLQFSMQIMTGVRIPNLLLPLGDWGACLILGTCEALRFDSNSNRPFRFDYKVMGRFENLRIGRAYPLLVVVKRLKPLTALTGTVYRRTSSMTDHKPVLFNVFVDWNEESVVLHISFVSFNVAQPMR